MRGLLLNDTSGVRHHGCDAVIVNMRDLLLKSGFASLRSKPCGFTDRICDRTLMEYLQAVDVVVVNGEGSIHHDNKRAMGLARIGKLANEVGVRSILLNATLYSNSINTLRMIGCFDYISVRDKQSGWVLKQLGVESQYCPDFTFYKNLGDVPHSHSGVRVGDSVRQDTKEALRNLGCQRGWTACSIHYPPGKGNVSNYITVHARHGAVLTGRFHDVCFCINAKIPFLAVESNTNKIQALMEDIFDSRQRLVSLDKLTEIERIPEFTTNEKCAIENYKSMARERFSELGTSLSCLRASS